MSYCPSCLIEYQSGVKRCANCDVALVDATPEENKPADGTSLIQLAVFPNTAAAHLIQELLENNGIEAVLRGDMDPIGNVTGTAPALLVQESAWPQAKEIYEAFFAGSGSESDEVQPEDIPGAADYR